MSNKYQNNNLDDDTESGYRASVYAEDEAAVKRYLSAVEEYKRARQPWWKRLLQKFGFHLAFIWFILFFTLGLCAQEMPSWVIPGMLAVETSSEINGGQIIYRNQSRGDSGEVGAFQALPQTLRQFNFSPSLFEQDPHYAMHATSAILRHYFAKTGSWESAVAAWNKGLRGRNKLSARRYVELVKASAPQ